MDTQLDARQRQTLEMLSTGESHKIIAKELGITQGAITQRLVRIFKKLGALNTTHAVAIALRQGIIK